MSSDGSSPGANREHPSALELEGTRLIKWLMTGCNSLSIPPQLLLYLFLSFCSSIKLLPLNNAPRSPTMAVVLSKPLLPASVRLPTEKSTKEIKAHLTSLYLKHRTRISRTVYLVVFVALLGRIRNAISEQKAASIHQEAARQRAATGGDLAPAQAKKRVELNREFFRNLFRLLRIVIPGWKSKEFRLVISHSFFLVARTLISLYVADLDGKLVSSLIRGKGREFLLGVVWWMIVALPATFTNSMVSTQENILSTRSN